MTPSETSLLLLQALRPDLPLSGQEPLSLQIWQELLDCSLSQGLAPLLYFRLKQANAESTVPAGVLSALQQAYYQNAARNLRLSHDLGRVLDYLTSHSIPVIVLKGAHLAAAIYPNPALRFMVDLDILLPAAEMSSALQVLAGIGYRSLTPPWLAKSHHAVLVSADEGVSLEVHWRLDASDSAFDAALAEVWQAAVPQGFSGRQALVMSAEDLVIYLCQHAALHHLYAQGLRALCDLDAILRLPGSLDWEKLCARAQRWELDRAVALTLSLCDTYLGTPVPPHVRIRLGFERISSAIVQGALVRLASLQEPERLASKFSMRFLAQAAPRERLRLLAGFIGEQIFLAAPPGPASAAPAARRFDMRALLCLLGELPSILWRLLHRKPGIFRQFKQQKDLASWLNP